jgi:hypothetical protein
MKFQPQSKVHFRSFVVEHRALEMATSRGLTIKFKSLSISPPCLRKISPQSLQTSQFSTSPIALSGPITRLRRERAALRLKASKARANQLREQRESRADPIQGHSTPFTDSLLRPREILAQPGVAAHTRSPDNNWPLLTNYGISGKDSLLLAEGAKAALSRRLEGINMKDPKTWSSTDKITYVNEIERREKLQRTLEEQDERKRDVMARLMDLTNANSGAVIAANLEKAMIHFGRHEGDTGSSEVQGSVSREVADDSGSFDRQDTCVEGSYGAESTG